MRRGRHNANRELGRALKTEFVLQYMSEPQLRAKVRRGLLKVEQLHAMARDESPLLVSAQIPVISVQVLHRRA